MTIFHQQEQSHIFIFCFQYVGGDSAKILLIVEEF